MLMTIGPPPQKKKTSGLVVFLAILGVLMGLTLVGVLVVGILVWRSPEARGVVGMFGELVAIQTKALKAPGTKELREHGCMQAMVFSFDDIQRVVSVLDAGEAKEELPFDEFVSCTVGSAKKAIACEAVSKTYISAVGARRRAYAVTVSVQGKKEAECSQLYEKDGTFLREGVDSGALGPVTAPPEEP